MSDVPEIDIDELASQLEAGVTVIDVREHHEYHEGHVPSALHIPLGSIPESLHQVPIDASVLVVCAVGGRSARAVEFLRARGVDATNVAGGTKAWIEAGRPVMSGADPH